MNPEEIQKAVTIIEKSEHIALVLPQETDVDILAAAEVIKETLNAKGKRVGFLRRPGLENAVHPDSYGALKNPPLLLKEFIISVDTSRPVSQLRYEREEKSIDIILSPKTDPLSSEAVSFREGKTLCDCVIALGIPDLEIFDAEHAYDVSLFTEAPIINLDIHGRNTLYGNTNIVNSEKSSLSELVYEFIVALFKEPIHAEQATLLLSGIIKETDGFKSPRTAAETFLIASELMRLGARQHDAFALAKPEPPLGLVQLFGRASVRSKIDPNTKIIWSFLTPEDFEKTGRTAADIPLILARLKSEFTAGKLCILLWQGPEETAVSGAAMGVKLLLELLQNRAGGELENTTLKLGTTYPTFRDAEEEIGALLAETL